MDVNADTRSDDKCMFGFPELCKRNKGLEEKSAQTGIRWGREKKNRERYSDQSVGTRVEKNRPASLLYRRKREERGVEGERKRSGKESVGDGFKLLVSHGDIGSSAAWLSSASHTISPLFTISPLSISLHLPPWCSDSQCDALFLSPSHSCHRYCVYHSLLFSLSLAEIIIIKKKLYLTYTCSLFLSHTHTHLLLTYCIFHQLTLLFFLYTLCLAVSLHTFLVPFTPGCRMSFYNNTWDVLL